MTQLLPPKKEVALALLERSNVDVYLDPRAKGVVVPPQFRKEPRLILKIGLNMPVPIPDLRLDDESMSCTLSFNRRQFFCVVPWSSVFAMVGEDGRGMVWPDDVPQELAVRVVDEQRPLADREGEPRSRAAPPSCERDAALDRASARGASSREATSAPPRCARPPRVAAARSPKEEEGRAQPRPMLVAVPPPRSRPPRVAKPMSGAPATAPAEQPRERPGCASRRAPPPAARRPKRELPPYLRVVK